MEPGNDELPSAPRRPIPPGRLRWRFGDVELDEARLQLTVGGTVKVLEPKPLDFLMFLLRQDGDVVTKDQLLQQLWPGRIVTEAALTKCVAKVRQALNDHDQSLIRTVHGYGYRIGVPVQVEAVAAPAPAPAATAPSRPKTSDRRLMAIVFTDMVGYTALVQRNEALARELLEFQRKLVRGMLGHYSGREIEVIGDAFLVEFPSALRATECAIAIQQHLDRHNAGQPEDRRVQLRIGLHLGDIERLDKGVFGDSVNIASRIQSVAPHGGVAVSVQIHDQIQNKLQAPFRAIGPTTLKGIERPVEIFVLDAAAISALPALVPPRMSARRWRLVAAGAAVLFITAAGLGLRDIWESDDAPPAASVNAPPSVAVLPFSNFSADQENAYFADGVHEAILTHLARVPGLKVTSRTSVMAYRDARQMSVRQIARTLKVAHIVEGSVQRAGSRVRITAQLIEAGTDRHLWADSYDREIADVFAIQSEVAQRISSSVHANLTPTVIKAIEQRPTSNPVAYDLYLRAMDVYRTTVDSAEDYRRMQGLLEQAIALDPEFSLAHAAIASVHISFYWWAYDLTPKRREQARIAAETALRLDPDSVEGHVSYGKYFYYGHRDYQRALAQFEAALARQPSGSDILAYIGYVHRRQGRWADAEGRVRQALELDPQNPTAMRGLAETLEIQHKFAQADALYVQWLQQHPDDVVVLVWRLELMKAWKGDLAFAERTLASIPPGVDPDHRVTLERVELALNQGRPADALRDLQSCDCPWVPLPGGSRYPKELMLADVHHVLGDSRQARTFYARAAELLEEDLKIRPEDARGWGYLGVARAGLGRQQAALEAAGKANELMPSTRDAMVATDVRELFARILMMTGRTDEAVAELVTLARNPGAFTAYTWKFNPVWKPIQSHPRFLELLSGFPH